MLLFLNNYRFIKKYTVFVEFFWNHTMNHGSFNASIFTVSVKKKFENIYSRNIGNANNRELLGQTC